MDKKIYSIAAVFALVVLSSHLYAVGMGDFIDDNSGSSSSGGGTGVPIDGGLLTVIGGAVGYAYRKLKKSEEI
jgi:hypothetical protein